MTGENVPSVLRGYVAAFARLDSSPLLRHPRGMGRNAPFLFVILALLGCKTRPLGPYISPRITGQVLAAENGQPLSGVTVARGNPERYRLPGPPPKGAELLLQKPVVHTGPDGRFMLASQRVLSLIRPEGWNLLELDLSRPGYQHFHTNLPIALATNSFSGEPLLDAGRILLQPIGSDSLL